MIGTLQRGRYNTSVRSIQVRPRDHKELVFLRSVPGEGYTGTNPNNGRNGQARAHSAVPVYPPAPGQIQQLQQRWGLTFSDDRDLRWLRGELAAQAEARDLSQSTEPIEGYPELFPYQTAGIRFLQYRKRVLCGDDTGLGKTAEALIAARETLHNGGNVLVLTLKALIPQWREQIIKWRIDPPGGVVDLSKPKGRKDIYLSHSKRKGALVLMNWDALTQLRELLSASFWTIVIGDESHLVKNRKAKRSEAMKVLCHNAENVWLLTGTPLEKSPADMWMLLHVLYPDVFTSYWAFVNAFVDYTPEWTGNMTINGARNIPLLHDLIAKLYIRRMRVDVLKDVHEPQTIHLAVELHPAEREQYDRIERGAYFDIEVEGFEASTTVVGRLIQARQAAISPRLLLPDFTGESAKVDTLLALLETVEDQRVVIFSSFRASCEYVAERIGPDAAVFFTDRDPAIFQSFAAKQGPRILVTTPQSLGTGANLQSATVMVFMDTPWSSIMYKQACARIVRIGQEGQPLIYHLHATGTVDEDIRTMIESKQATFNEVAVARHVLDRLTSRWLGATAPSPQHNGIQNPDQVRSGVLAAAVV